MNDAREFSSAAHALKMMCPEDARWVLGYALLFSLAQDLARARSAGLWMDSPLEIEKKNGGRWVDMGGGQRVKAGFLLKEFLSPRLDDLCATIQAESGGAIVVRRAHVARMAKSMASHRYQRKMCIGSLPGPKNRRGDEA